MRINVIIDYLADVSALVPCMIGCCSLTAFDVCCFLQIVGLQALGIGTLILFFVCFYALFAEDIRHCRRGALNVRAIPFVATRLFL